MIAGPTAAGKSEIALLLAQRMQGEIISVDSMQVYRGLDIGTAKPTARERASIRHHLIDVLELKERFDAAQFVRLARQAVEDIRSRGRVPILCGGTGLYFKAFLEGLGGVPSSDPGLRRELEQLPLEQLLEELERNDPEAFARMDRQNPRRVIRAVEVFRLTGKPASAQKASWQSPETSGHRVYGLQRQPEDLRARIDQRVDRMFAAGLVAETKALLEQGLGENPTALQAIGYRQVVEHLRAERSLPETVALVKQKTRQFAKRQMTWFRQQLPMRWIEVGPAEPAEEIVQRLEAESL